jgi:hypothetical protein
VENEYEFPLGMPDLSFIKTFIIKMRKGSDVPDDLNMSSTQQIHQNGNLLHKTHSNHHQGNAIKHKTK